MASSLRRVDFNGPFLLAVSAQENNPFWGWTESPGRSLLRAGKVWGTKEDYIACRSLSLEGWKCLRPIIGRKNLTQLMESGWRSELLKASDSFQMDKSTRKKIPKIFFFSEKHLGSRILNPQWIMSEKYNGLSAQVKNNCCKSAWASLSHCASIYRGLMHDKEIPLLHS